MNNIDELFREKLNATSGRYEAGMWAKMEAMLAKGGATLLWRNVRNAGLLVLAIGIFTIDFLMPQKQLTYTPRMESFSIVEQEENTVLFSSYTRTAANTIMEEPTIQADNTGAESVIAVAEKSASKTATQNAATEKPTDKNQHTAGRIIQETEPIEATTPIAEAIAIEETQPEETMVAESTEMDEEVEEEANEIASTEPEALATEEEILAEQIDPLQAKDAMSRLSVSALGFGGTAFRNISGLPSAYTERKEAEEQAGWYTSAQVHLAYQFGKLSASVGFGQWTQNENLSYTNQLNGNLPQDNGFWDVNTQTFTTVDSNWVIAGIYQGHWNYDTTFSTVIDSAYVSVWDTAFGAYDTSLAAYNGQHQLRYMEVPIMLSYRIPLRKMDLEISGGMSFGFYSSSTGKQYLNADQSGVLSSGQQKALFQSPVYSALLGVGVAYPIANHWELLAQLQGRYTLNSLVSPEYWTQRYLQLGLGAGVRYRL